jgi:hypothetical protein
MSFNIKNNNINFSCAPMYNSNNNQIMAYMCSPAKNIENFTSKISSNGCNSEDTLFKNVCAKQCPPGFTDTSGSLICSEKRAVPKRTYIPRGTSGKQCRVGDSLNSSNMCVLSCPRGSIDISGEKCSRTYYTKKKTYPPISETTGSEIKTSESRVPSENRIPSESNLPLSEINCKSGFTSYKDSCVQKCPVGFADSGPLTCSEKTTTVKNMYPPSNTSQNRCKSEDFFDRTENKCTTRCPFGFADTRNGFCTKTLAIKKKSYKPTS